MHVLLVEDSLTLQSEISDSITKAGHSITVAKDGETAVQVMEFSGADLIICDIEMPGLDGFETVSIIREALGEFWVPIIFLTQRNSVADYITGIEVGADDYLLKPINERVLHAKIKVMERFIIMQQQLNEALNAHEKSKTFDNLTNVYSAKHFNELAKLQWSILARQKQPASILAIQIDCFEAFKAQYGEAATNQCIQQVAARVSSSIHRPGDFTGRVDENQFLVMLPETSQSGAEKISEKILLAIESLNIENNKSNILGVVSASIGGQTVANLKTSQLPEAIETAESNLQVTQETSGNAFQISTKIERHLTNLSD